MDTTFVAVAGGWAAVIAGATGHDKIALGIVALLIAGFAWGPSVNIETLGVGALVSLAFVGACMAAFGAIKWLTKEGW